MSNEQDNSMEADVLAATLHEGLQESQDLLDFLALKLEGPLSHLTTVRRKGGLFSKKHTVEEITFRFDEHHFRITREPHGSFTAKILKEVRGIVLKTDVVEIDHWIRRLSEELAHEAERSVSFRNALSQFILE